MTNLIEEKKRTPWIAPVFIPHLGCSHRCVFCNQHLISRTASQPTPRGVRERLDRFFLSRKHHGGRERQIAFYGGSFTGMDRDLQRAYLETARDYLRRGLIDSIRVSARPDELATDQLHFLREHGVKTVEIGVQSLSDRVLRESRRGCSARDAVRALRRVRESGLEAGAQIMAGLPGDSGAEGIKTAEDLAELRPDFVRIYPLIVFRETELAERFQSGRYRPLALQEAVSLCARMLECFERASVPVIRMGLQAEEGMEGAVLAGPVHPAFGFLVKSFRYRQRLLNALPGKRLPGSGVRFRIHPHDRPLFSGHRRENIRWLQARIGTEKVYVDEDERFPRGRVECIIDPSPGTGERQVVS